MTWAFERGGEKCDGDGGEGNYFFVGHVTVTLGFIKNETVVFLNFSALARMQQFQKSS